MPWAIHVGDTDYRLDDLTVLGAAQVCETGKCSLVTLDPVGQPAHLAALVAAFTCGPERSFDDALLAVVQENVGDVVREFLRVTEDV